MVKRLSYYLGKSDDPYYNLAVEQYLMETAPADTCILYLWQNRHTVVIGRNQNAWAECRTTQLEADGGHLARRLSGGGAVYHDMGNLNFTFLLSRENYDVARQLQVIVTACKNLGIAAEATGRNDVTADGRKFSGNAFYDAKGQAYHHGTLLVEVDMARLGQYLMPSKAKLQSKGVDSVRSRVVNLTELCPGLTVSKMRQEMLRAFCRVYGLQAQELTDDRLDMDYVNRLAERNASWEWNYGKSLPASFSCEARFDWGSVTVEAKVEQGAVKQVRVYSDSMDWRISQQLQQALTLCRFTVEDMCSAVEKTDLPQTVKQDISNLLRRQNI